MGLVEGVEYTVPPFDRTYEGLKRDVVGVLHAEEVGL